jgi:pimeloyl-ACP methyl ester carboxylesterase
MDISEIRFAKNGEMHLAYQVYGSGPPVLIVPPIISNVEMGWEEETYRRVREHLGRHVRVVEFDKRGMGSSDRFEQMPSLEERVGDIEAVMDAEGISKACLVGVSEGGLMAEVFAARHPERVERLVVINSYGGGASLEKQEPYAAADDPEYDATEVMAAFEQTVKDWGRKPESFLDTGCPSQRGNEAFVRWFGRFQRTSMSPAGFDRQWKSALELDPTNELPNIQAPTLVIQVKGDRIVPAKTGRWLAATIPNARYVEFPGEDHFCWCSLGWRAIMDCWLEFVTGAQPQHTLERRFATIVFTDITDSTGRCAQLGDEAWSALLERHDAAARRGVARHGGTVVKNTGDGLLATFAMPSAALTFVSELKQDLAADNLGIRGGVHAGEIEIRDDGDVVGLAVTLAARVMGVAKSDSLFVSSTVRDLLMGGRWSLEDRGEHELKGLEGAWRLFEVCP